MHTCYESQEKTDAILRVLLHGIDTMDSDMLAPYLQIFVALVSLGDSQQLWRVAYAMARMLRVIANNMRYKVATISCLRMLIKMVAHARCHEAGLEPPPRRMARSLLDRRVAALRRFAHA